MSLDVSTILSSGLQLVADKALPFAIALAGVGVIGMAIQQAVKDFWRMRCAFHQRRVRAWLAERGVGPVVVHEPDGESTARPSSVETQLIALATGGDADALFELPAENLAAQLGQAGRLALLFPSQYSDVLRALTGKVCLDEIALVAEARKPDSVSRADPKVIDEALVRIGHVLDRNLDALQIVLSADWDRYNKWWAFVCCFAVAAMATAMYLYTMESAPASPVRLGLTAAAIGLLGGFLAPIAKDLATALQSLKKA